MPAEAREYIWPPELEFEMAVSLLKWVLGTRLRSCGRAASVLTCWAVSPVPGCALLKSSHLCLMPFPVSGLSLYVLWSARESVDLRKGSGQLLGWIHDLIADELFWRLFWGQGYMRAPGFHTLLIFGHLAVVVWVWVLTGSKWTAPSIFTRQILGHPCFPEPMAELRLQTWNSCSY